MRVRYRAADGQTESRSAAGAPPAGIDPVKPIEDTGLMFRRNSQAGIGDPQVHLCTSHFAANGHRFPGWGVG